MAYWLEDTKGVDRTLSPYQVRKVNHLRTELTHKQVALLNATMGSGKSLMSRYLTQLLIKDKTIKGCVVGCPQSQIKPSWSQSSEVGLPTGGPDHTAHIRRSIKLSKYKWPIPEDNEQAEEVNKQIRKAIYDGVVVTQQTLMGDKIDLVGLDLTGFLLIIDEAHHLGTSTTLFTKFVKPWLDAGGKLLMVTATAWRTEGDLFLPDDVIPAMWSFAQHVESGYAPANGLRVTTHELKNTTLTSSTKAGKLLITNDGSKDTAEQAVALWVKWGKPKYIHNIPARGNTTEYAKLLQAEFEKAGARVFNGVGTSLTVKKAMGKFIRREHRRISEGKKSKFDVLIVVMRGKEGTDWPVASHIGTEGISSSTIDLIQRAGRGTRLKRGRPDGSRLPLPDYADPSSPYYKFGDQTVLCFLVADKQNKKWSDFWTAMHREAAFLIGALMCGAEATDYLAKARMRGNPKRPRSGKPNPDNQAVWDGILAVVDLTKVQFKGHMANLRAIAAAIGRPPTDEELRQHLIHGFGCSKEEADKHILVKDTAYAFQNEKVIQRAAADADRGLFGAATSRQLVLDHLQTIFHDLADEMIDNNKALFEETMQFARAFSSEITGQDAQTIRKKLASGLPVPRITVEHAEKAIHNFYKEHRYTPEASSGFASRYLHGFNITFRQINTQLQKTHGTCLQHLCDRLYPPTVTKTDQQIRFEKSVRKRTGIFEALAEDIVQQVAAHPYVQFSVRAIDEARRLRGETLLADAGAGSNYYATTLATLIPAFTGKLKVAKAANPWVIDWTALGIDPTDTKWDDYHVRAGGTLPRPLPIPGINIELPGPLAAIRTLLLDGQWHDLNEIAQAAGTSITSTSARIRDLRKAKYGGLNIEFKPNKDGGVYRLLTTAASAKPIITEFEEFIRSNPDLPGQYIEAAERSFANGARQVSVRFLLGAARNGIEDIPTYKNALSPYLACLIKTLRPDLAPRISDGNGHYTPNLTALGIDPSPTDPPPPPTPSVNAVLDFFDALGGEEGTT